MPRGRLFRLLAVLLLALFALRMAGSALVHSPTFDELTFGPAGALWLARGVEIMTDHPPLFTLAAGASLLLAGAEVPEHSGDLSQTERFRYGGELLLHANRERPWLIHAARAPGLLAGAALCGLVWLLSRRWWGEEAGLLSLVLVTASPNVLAHTQQAVNDVPVTFLLVLCLWLLARQGTGRRLPLLLGAGAILGLAVATKWSALLIVALVPVLLWLVREERDGRRLRRVAAESLLVLLAAGAVAMVALGPHRLMDRVWGFRVTMRQTYTAGRAGYFAGERWWKPIPLFHATSLLLKEPEGAVLLWAAAGGALAAAGGARRRRRAAYLLLPAAAFLAAGAASRYALGIRHVLVIVPLLAVFAGITLRGSPSRGRRAVVWSLAGLALLSSLLAHPHYLGYLNAFGGGRSRAHLWFCDSNLDWGQELPSLRRFLEERPDSVLYLSYFGSADPTAQGVPHITLPGFLDAAHPEGPVPPGIEAQRKYVAVSATNLNGLYFADLGRYDWLRGREPAAVFGGALFVYDITGDPAPHLLMGQLFLNRGEEEKAWAEVAAARRIIESHRSRSGR